MKTIILTLMLGSLIAPTNNFLSNQKKYERVRDAYKKKELVVKEQLKKHNLELDNLNILLIAYKDEQILELYAKTKRAHKYKKILTYTVCEKSGELGPKRKQGDYQVPEGFYHIDRFNPASNYHLSLGINYPNQSDKKKSMVTNLGGDIFIHGNCVTVGCLPITNDKIKEIYIYALQAKHTGQDKIPVYIFPFKFTERNINKFKEIYKANKPLLNFWDNLKTGYDNFKKDLQELKFTTNRSGDYIYIE